MMMQPVGSTQLKTDHCLKYTVHRTILKNGKPWEMLLSSCVRETFRAENFYTLFASNAILHFHCGGDRTSVRKRAPQEGGWQCNQLDFKDAPPRICCRQRNLIFHLIWHIYHMSTYMTPVSYVTWPHRACVTQPYQQFFCTHLTCPYQRSHSKRLKQTA